MARDRILKAGPLRIRKANPDSFMYVANVDAAIRLGFHKSLYRGMLDDGSLYPRIVRRVDVLYNGFGPSMSDQAAVRRK